MQVCGVPMVRDMSDVAHGEGAGVAYFSNFKTSATQAAHRISWFPWTFCIVLLPKEGEIERR